MFENLAKLTLAVALAGAAAPSRASADAGDDQYAVAAGHYARDRWQLAVAEFEAFRRKFPQHKKISQALFFEAEAHVQLGQFDKAVELFRAFVKQDPTNRYHRQALFRWGEGCYLLKDFAAARPVLEEFRRTYSRDSLNAYVLVYLGQIELEAKDLQVASERFNESLKQFPDSQVQDEGRYGLARVAEQQGDAEGAERIYLALSSKAGSAWADDAQFRLGSLQYTEAEYATAVETFAEFERRFPQSDLLDRALLGRGWAWFKQQQWDKARQQFETLQNSKDVGLEARYWLGLTHKAQKNWKPSAEVLLAASNVDGKHPLTPAIVFHAGEALARIGNLPNARKQFDRVISTWPKDDWADDARLARLQLELAETNHKQIDQQYTEFLAQFPESEHLEEARRVKAQSLLARKQYEQAAALIRDAKDGAADSLADRYLLAASLQGLDRFDEAEAELAPVLESATGSLLADAQLLDAALHVDQKDFAGAIPSLQAYLAANPQGSESARGRAQLATCYAWTKDLEQARKSFQAFTSQKPSDELRRSATQQLAEAVFAAKDYAWSAELFQSISGKEEPAGTAARALSGLGWSRYEAGELELAAAVFGQLIQRYPEQTVAPEALLARGQILERIDKLPEALTMYQQLLEKHPADARRPQAMRAAARMQDKLGKNELSAAGYELFVTEFPQHEFVAAAIYEWAWVLRELDRLDEADKKFERIYSEHRQSPYWADATFRLAERAQALKRSKDAQRLLADLIESKPEEKLKPHVQYLQGQAAASLEQWPAVISHMRPLTEGRDDSPFKHLAEYWTAEALYRQGDFAAADERLKELAKQVESSQEAWTAMVSLRHAQVLANQKKWLEAQKTAEQISQRWPQFEQQYEADYVIGRALAARGEFDDARAAYQRVIDSDAGGKTETAAMAQWMVGETYYHQKNYETALREYLRLEILYDYPTWQAAALLQAGKCAEQLGQWKQAVEHYQRVVKDFAETSFVDEAQKRLTAARERLAGR